MSNVNDQIGDCNQYTAPGLMGKGATLSICIPTYNRAKCLEETILSIVSQKRFQETNDVEIVVSDNCSDDSTTKTALALIDTYGAKIRYYRNDPGIFLDLNFAKALSYGRGTFLKLNNDTLKHSEGSLDEILHTIDENKKSKNILFFSNGTSELGLCFLCDNLNDFVDNVSYYSGWIGGFGIWKEDFEEKNFNRCARLKLPQVDVLFRLINSQRNVCVNNKKLFTVLPPQNKGGYDLLDVFLGNYIFLLSEQLNNKTLSAKVFVSEKKKLLLQFIRPWLVNIKVNPSVYTFDCKCSLQRIIRCYRKDILTLVIFGIYYSVSLCRGYVNKVVRTICRI